MSIQFFWYPRCGTCQKAKKWLDQHNIEYEAIHIVENPPRKQQLKEWLEKSELPIKRFFNTSGMKYRELGLKDKLEDMSENEKLELLAKDGMLIKRPIATDGEKVTVGFKEETYQNTWK